MQARQPLPFFQTLSGLRFYDSTPHRRVKASFCQFCNPLEAVGSHPPARNVFPSSFPPYGANGTENRRLSLPPSSSYSLTDSFCWSLFQRFRLQHKILFSFANRRPPRFSYFPSPRYMLRQKSFFLKRSPHPVFDQSFLFFLVTPQN